MIGGSSWVQEVVEKLGGVSTLGGLRKMRDWDYGITDSLGLDNGLQARHRLDILVEGFPGIGPGIGLLFQGE